MMPNLRTIGRIYKYNETSSGCPFSLFFSYFRVTLVRVCMPNLVEEINNVQCQTEFVHYVFKEEVQHVPYQYVLTIVVVSLTYAL